MVLTGKTGRGLEWDWVKERGKWWKRSVARQVRELYWTVLFYVSYLCLKLSVTSACDQSIVLALLPTYSHKCWLTAVISKEPIKPWSIICKNCHLSGYRKHLHRQETIITPLVHEIPLTVRPNATKICSAVKVKNVQTQQRQRKEGKPVVHANS